MEKKALGRGLNAIFSSTALLEMEQREEHVEIPVQSVVPSQNQPRRRFDQFEIDELAASIRNKGVIQPVLVRETAGGTYELIAGERRWRAASLAGLRTIPALVKHVSDHEAMELALIENLQRADLTPIEVAHSYERLIKEFSLTQEELAERLGKTRSSIANTLRLLALPQSVRDLVESRQLSMGHAKVLLSLKQWEEQHAWAIRAVKDGWSVRDLEQALQKKPRRQHRVSRNPDPNVARVENQLKRRLGTNARIVQGKTGGKIIIDYAAIEDLERILDIVLH